MLRCTSFASVAVRRYSARVPDTRRPWRFGICPARPEIRKPLILSWLCTPPPRGPLPQHCRPIAATIRPRSADLRSLALPESRGHCYSSAAFPPSGRLANERLCKFLPSLRVGGRKWVPIRRRPPGAAASSAMRRRLMRQRICLGMATPHKRHRFPAQMVDVLSLPGRCSRAGPVEPQLPCRCP